MTMRSRRRFGKHADKPSSGKRSMRKRQIRTYVGDRKIAMEGGSRSVSLDLVDYAPVILSSIHLERSRCRVIAGSSKAIFFRERVYSESASSTSYSCGRPLEKHRTREIPTEESRLRDIGFLYTAPLRQSRDRTAERDCGTSRVIKMQFSIFLVCFRLPSRRKRKREKKGDT